MPSTVKESLLRGLPFLLVGLGFVITVVLRGAVPFPLSSDHAYFLPASWWFAESGNLANPWVQSGFDQAFNWHGFLQPWIVGVLARLFGGGWAGTYLAIDLLAAGTIVAVALVARALDVPPLRATALVLLTIGLMLDARSRPEVLATLETVLLVYAVHGLVMRFPAAPWHAAGAGALCGALLITHPVAAVFSCLAVAAVMGVMVIERGPPLRTILGLALAMGAGFALALLVLFLVAFDGQITVWLDGMSRHSKMILARTDNDGFVRYYLTNRFLPGFVLFFVPAAVTVWTLLSPSPSSRAAPLRWALLALVASAGAYLVYRFAIRIPATYYNVTGLIVATCLVAAIAPLPRGRRLVTDAVVGMVAMGALAGTLLWSAQALDERALIAPSRTELAAAIGADRAAGRRVCGDTAVLAALDSPAIAREVAVSLRLSDGPATPDPAVCDVYYALQSHSGKEPAAPTSGFVSERQALLTSSLTRIGIRPFHYGFARWVSERAR